MTVAEPQQLSAGAVDCQWTYYLISGANLQPEHPLFNDPNNTSIIDLNLGNFDKGKATHLASTGSTDFNRDNKTDVFRNWPRSDGNLQWQYSSGGTGPWRNLAYAGANLLAWVLQFGEFDANVNPDVFASVYSSGAFHWRCSPSGLASFVTLHTASDFADRLALGDSNGDGIIGVFTLKQDCTINLPLVVR